MKKLTPVSFHGDILYLVECNGEPFIPAKPISENLGLDWKTQYRKFQEDARRWQVKTVKVQTAGGRQEMLCIPLRKLPAWLYSISPAKVKEELREKLIRYQEECDRVLWEHWMKARSLPARGDEEPVDLDEMRELFREAEEKLRRIRALELEEREDEEAMLEFTRRAVLGARAALGLKGLGLSGAEISALFLAYTVGRPAPEAARIAGVLPTEAEEAYRLFLVLSRDPWEVLEAAETFRTPLPWEEEPGIRAAARTVENAIRRLCARAESLEVLSSLAPKWLRIRKDRVYVLPEVLGEIGMQGGDVWVLADLLGWRRGYCAVSEAGRKRDVRAGWLPVREFRARYFEGERPAEAVGPEPVRRMAEWLIRTWTEADEKHRVWLEKQFVKAFPDFAAEERD